LTQVHDFLPFIVIGLTTGSVYGLAGTGLVLTYKTSGIFNFAQGSLATVAVFIFFWLHAQHHMAWPLAGLIAVFAVGPALGVLMELMARVLQDAADVLKIAATIGIVIAVIAIGDIWYGQTTETFPHYLPTSTIRVLGVNVSWEQIVVIVTGLVATAALYWFFRVSRLGMAMRGVVDDPSLISMTGESPVLVRRWAWIIGATFATLSGVLLAPSLSVNGIILTELFVQAFGAAAIGYFSSLPLTYVGGLALGIAGALCTKYVAQYPSLAGLPPGLPFIVLFVVLIVTPRALLAAKRYVPNIRIADPWYAPPRIRVGFGTLFVIFMCFIPTIVGTKLAVYSQGLTDVILFVSLGLLIRVSGQVSLCQYAFAAVGAAAMGHLAGLNGVPWLLALLLSGLIAVPIGAIIAIPAIRLSGVFLALATLGFGILLEQMFYTMNFMFGPTTSGIAVPRPDWNIGPLHTSTDKGFYFVILFFAVLAALGMVGIMKSRLGRVLGAMSDSPLALETLGTTVNVSKVLVFCISSFMAAIAGALSASLFSFAIGSEFSSFSSLTLVALVAIIPIGAPWFAVMAAFGLDVLPAYLNINNIQDYLSMVFGVSAVLAPLTLAKHPGAPQPVRKLAYRIDAMIPRRKAKEAPQVEVAHPVRGGGLEITDLTVAYGGAVAVSDLSLTAPVGRITGLIGPNGAGKTTTFNAASGLVKPTRGHVLLHGADVSGLGPAARARRGLGRTFQRADLFNTLTVRENIEIGREAVMAGGNPVSQMVASNANKLEVRAAADDVIELTGISSLLDIKVGDISTGQKRLVELARVLAGPFDMILLDEPSSGLDANETEQFGHILTRIVSERGIGILLVEHDMALVRQVCDQVWVLDFGELIFQGSSVEMMQSDIVKAAYLGSEGGPSDTAAGQAQATTGTATQ
jgi:ABC-type branched-subunit amino acid transport system ATPase component/branched-subunit amino acid ABC-type transport system permease component